MKNRSIDGVKPYERNAKKHPDWHIEKIANSIKAFGCKQPVVLDKDGVIVAGHGRFEAMTKLLGFTMMEEKASTAKGEAVIPFVTAGDLTEEEVKAYRLADNQLNSLTGIDQEMVVAELGELSSAMIELTGHDLEKLTDATVDFGDKNGEVDIDKMGEGLDVRCPKCGFEFAKKDE